MLTFCIESAIIISVSLSCWRRYRNGGVLLYTNNRLNEGKDFLSLNGF